MSYDESSKAIDLCDKATKNKFDLRGLNDVKKGLNQVNNSIEKFGKKIETQIIIHPKNFSADSEMIKIPPYMLWCLF